MRISKSPRVCSLNFVYLGNSQGQHAGTFLLPLRLGLTHVQGSVHWVEKMAGGGMAHRVEREMRPRHGPMGEEKGGSMEPFQHSQHG